MDWYWLYIFVRTAIYVEHSEDSVSALNECLSSIEDYESGLQFYSAILLLDAISWKNGFIIRFPVVGDPKDVASVLQRGLKSLDGWAIHNASNFGQEQISWAPLSDFFKSHDSQPFCQVYIKYDMEDASSIRIVEDLKAELEKKAQCKHVFHFSDGVVWFIKSDQPPETIAARCHRAASRLQSLLVITPDGRALSLKGHLDDAWDHYFEQEEDEGDS